MQLFMAITIFFDRVQLANHKIAGGDGLQMRNAHHHVSHAFFIDRVFAIPAFAVRSISVIGRDSVFQNTPRSLI